MVALWPPTELARNLHHGPPPAAPPAPSAAQRTLYNQVRTLKLDVSQIVPVHGNPVPWTEFLRVTGAR